MPAFDACHDQVTRSLEKDGWRVTHTPYRLALPPRFGYVDLRLSRGANGQRENIMLVEIKCFPNEDSTTRDLYTAIGQYLVYRAMMETLDLSEALFLAVPETIFAVIFDQPVMQVIKQSQIRMVIVDLAAERIVQWI